MTPAKPAKCAHPVCSCMTAGGKYCSTECQAREKTPGIDCHCGHPGCKGNTH
jgi:metallothionein